MLLLLLLSELCFETSAAGGLLSAAFAELSDDLDVTSDVVDDVSDWTLLLLEASACDLNECFSDEALSEVVNALLPLLLPSEIFISDDELSDAVMATDFAADEVVSRACLRLFMRWRGFARVSCEDDAIA